MLRLFLVLALLCFGWDNVWGKLLGKDKKELDKNVRPRVHHIPPAHTCLEHYLRGYMTSGIYPIRTVAESSEIRFIECKMGKRDEGVWTIVHNDFRRPKPDATGDVLYQRSIEKLVHSGEECSQEVVVLPRNGGTPARKITETGKIVVTTLAGSTELTGSYTLKGTKAEAGVVKVDTTQTNRLSVRLGPLKCKTAIATVHKFKTADTGGRMLAIECPTKAPSSFSFSMRTLTTTNYILFTNHLGFKVKFNDGFLTIALSPANSWLFNTSGRVLYDGAWHRIAVQKRTDNALNWFIDGEPLEVVTNGTAMALTQLCESGQKFHFEHLEGADYAQFEFGSENGTLQGATIIATGNTSGSFADEHCYTSPETQLPIFAQGKCQSQLRTADFVNFVDPNKHNGDERVPLFIQLEKNEALLDDFSFAFESKENHGVLVWSHFVGEGKCDPNWNTAYLQVHYDTDGNGQRRIHLVHCPSVGAKVPCYTCSVTYDNATPRLTTVSVQFIDGCVQLRLVVNQRHQCIVQQTEGRHQDDMWNILKPHLKKTSRTYLGGLPRGPLPDRKLKLCDKYYDETQQHESFCATGINSGFAGSFYKNFYWRGRQLIDLSDIVYADVKGYIAQEKNKHSLAVNTGSLPTPLPPSKECNPSYVAGLTSNCCEENHYGSSCETSRTTAGALTTVNQTFKNAWLLKAVWLLLQTRYNNYTSTRVCELAIKFSNYEKVKICFLTGHRVDIVSSETGSSLLSGGVKFELSKKDNRLHYLILRSEPEGISATVDGEMYWLRKKPSPDGTCSIFSNAVKPETVVLYDFGYQQEHVDNNGGRFVSTAQLLRKTQYDRKKRASSNLLTGTEEYFVDETAIAASSKEARLGGPYYRVSSAQVPPGGLLTVPEKQVAVTGLDWWHIVLIILLILLLILLVLCLFLMCIRHRNIKEQEDLVAGTTKNAKNRQLGHEDLQALEKEPPSAMMQLTPPPSALRKRVESPVTPQTKTFAMVPLRTKQPDPYRRSEVTGAFAEMPLLDQEPREARIARLSEYVDEDDKFVDARNRGKK